MKPTKEQMAHPEPLATRPEAETTKDWIESFHEIGGLAIVEHQGLFYVVYGADYYHGYPV